VPLKIANPEHEAAITTARDLPRYPAIDGIDGEPGVLQRLLCVAERVKRIKHFAFKPLHVLQRDIEKVSTSARRVEDATVHTAGGTDGRSIAPS